MCEQEGREFRPFVLMGPKYKSFQTGARCFAIDLPIFNNQILLGRGSESTYELASIVFRFQNSLRKFPGHIDFANLADAIKSGRRVRLQKQRTF